MRLHIRNLLRIRKCTGDSSEHWLLADMISTKRLCAGTFNVGPQERIIKAPFR